MKSSKVIPITREFNKQKLIDAICAEMTPIQKSSYFAKEQQVVVEAEGNVIIIRLMGYNQMEDKKSKRKNRKQNQVLENQKIYFQSVKLVFNEKNCKVTLEWPFGSAGNIGHLSMDGFILILILITFIALWIPVVNALWIPMAIVITILYLILMKIQDKKVFKEFEAEILGIIESYI